MCLVYTVVWPTKYDFILTLLFCYYVSVLRATSSTTGTFTLNSPPYVAQHKMAGIIFKPEKRLSLALTFV